MNPKSFDDKTVNLLRDMILKRLSEEYEYGCGCECENEDDSSSKSLSKKDECIANMEDFIELMAALCPNEEELIRHRGNEIIEEIKKL